MIKWLSTLLYMVLFSGLGTLSFLLLVNYTDIPYKISQTSSNSIGIIVVYLLSFNIIGYVIMKSSSWINSHYSRNFKNKWIVLGICLSVMLMLLLLNYGLLAFIKAVADTPYPIFRNNNGVRLFYAVWLVEMIIMGLMLINRSMRDNFKYQQQVSELKDESDKARYTALQNQLNPHFLFNTLNTLIAEIEYDPKNAVNFTRDLANVYRYVLQSQDKPLVTLRDELEFVRSYLFLHEVRIGGYICYSQTVSDEYLENMIPPLTLQLLIENILKHNSITKKREMKIDVFVERDFVVVSNTINLKKNIESTGIGLRNLSNRCQLILGRDIVISKNNEIFRVKIPMLYEQN